MFLFPVLTDIKETHTPSHLFAVLLGVGVRSLPLASFSLDLDLPVPGSGSPLPAPAAAVGEREVGGLGSILRLLLSPLPPCPGGVSPFIGEPGFTVLLDCERGALNLDP